MGQVLHCKHSDCKKLLAKNANLPVGSYIEIKCAHCGKLNCVCVNSKGIQIKTFDLTENKKPEIMFLRIK